MIYSQGFRRAGLAAVTVILIASCSSSDGESSATTEDLSGRPGNSVTVTTSEPTGSSVDAPTSSAPATAATDVETTTSVAASTEAPTTVVDDTPEGGVIASVEFFEQQWKTCLSTLPDCDMVAATERRGGDVNVETNITAELFISNDYRASRIEELDYRVDAVTIAADGVTATATVCVTDPVGIAKADGTPVNDAYLSSIEKYGLEVRAGDSEWTWITRTPIDGPVEGAENSICV
jgi:hypothetical protein